jgi:hypothetical protein
LGAKIRRKRKNMPAAGRPSLFFLIALALGLILLAWVAYEAVSHPVKPPKKTGTASAITSVRA